MNIIKRIEDMQDFLLSKNFAEQGLVYNLLTDCKNEIKELTKKIDSVIRTQE